MNLIEVVILIFTVQISSFLMFILAINYREKGKMKNPIEMIKMKKEEKQQREEYELKQKQNKTMMENINNYNGTPLGQKDIPTNN